jgi:hypothetical protein
LNCLTPKDGGTVIIVECSPSESTSHLRRTGSLLERFNTLCDVLTALTVT